MNRLFTRFGVILFVLMVVSGARAQFLRGTFGDPCTYSLWGAQGSTGCQSVGYCDPQVINGPATIDVSWFENWRCWQGFVQANGGITEVYDAYLPSGSNVFTSILTGLRANGHATVHFYYADGTEVISNYNGTDMEDCNGNIDYSGPYNYCC